MYDTSLQEHKFRWRVHIAYVLTVVRLDREAFMYNSTVLSIFKSINIYFVHILLYVGHFRIR